MAISFIAGCGAATVLYVEAIGRVDALLARPIWGEEGRITGEIVLNQGLAVSPEQVADVLQGAGYSRVERPKQDGDFTLGQDSIFILNDSVEYLVTFRDDVVESVSPSSLVRFHATELTGFSADSNERRQPVLRADVPEHVVEAVLAMEDARFFDHPGVDFLGILRAIVVNIRKSGHAQGGSTLTQQLAKNLFLTPERTLQRKLRELALAVALEKRLSKDEILELYLNQIYLGQVGGVAICGIDQAARTYFGRGVERISLGQAATLAGIISAPNRYSPIRHPEKAQERRDVALGRLERVGWITTKEANRVRSEAFKSVRPRVRRKAPWALDSVVSEAETAFGKGAVAEKTLTIQTTIDALLQIVAERSVAEGLAEIEKKYGQSKGAEAALVAVDVKTGAVLAMVGGRKYGASSFNRATLGRRQVGSTIKPLTWLYAFEDDPDLAPNSMVLDEPIEREVNGEIWAPRNYDGEFVGELTMEDALAQSRNIPAILVAESVGMESLAKRWNALGLTSAKPYPSAALGAFDSSPTDLAAAYTVFPGMGRAVRPTLIRSVRLPNGEEGWDQKIRKQRVASARAAFLATSSLQAVMSKGTGKSAAQYGLTGFVGGKTGTTDNGRDAWFVGFTDSIAVAVWVGFDKEKDLGLTGAQAALPIWAKFVSGSGRIGAGPEAPDTVVSVPLCDETGQIAMPDCPSSTVAWFSEGSQEGGSCELHVADSIFGTAGIIESIRAKLNQKSNDSPQEAEEEQPSQSKRKRRRRQRKD
jgi:penicillin-binding protein 1B